jgi:hypothetical protein
MQSGCKAVAASRNQGINGAMPHPRKVVRYTLEALLILIPLAALLYFMALPDQFDVFLDWLFRIHR